MRKPLCYDLYCGLGGWAEGFLAEGWRVIGFDIERHDYGTGGYPGELVLQDIRTVHGAQLKDADIIVASSPCQEFSYRAMPWKRAKALGPPVDGINLFYQSIRIQYEANAENGYHCDTCEDARMVLRTPAGYGHSDDLEEWDRCPDCMNKSKRYIPLIMENVCGAQKWLGRAAWHYGSFYLWGDVPALMPKAAAIKNGTLGGGSWFGISETNTVLGKNPDGRKIAHAAKQFDGQRVNGERNDPQDGVKVSGLNWSGSDKPGYKAQAFNTTAVQRFGWRDSAMDKGTSKVSARKAASAQIAKIPMPLAQWIAKVYKPDCVATASAGNP